jgi:hypothetical protein
VKGATIHRAALRASIRIAAQRISRFNGKQTLIHPWCFSQYRLAKKNRQVCLAVWVDSVCSKRAVRLVPPVVGKSRKSRKRSGAQKRSCAQDT